MAALDPRGDWMGRGALALKNSRTATGEESLEKLYSLLGDLQKMTRTKIELIHSAGFLVSVIHGRHDIIAKIYYARRLAEKPHPIARMIELHGGHLVSHERTEEVNQAILELIKASEVSVNPNEWTNLPRKKSGWIGPRVTLIRINTEGGSNISIMLYVLSRLNIFLLYLLVSLFWHLSMDDRF